MKYDENNYSYQTLIHFWSVEHKVVINVLYRVNYSYLKEGVSSCYRVHGLATMACSRHSSLTWRKGLLCTIILKVLDIPSANIDQIRDLLPPSIFYHCRKWNLKYLSLNTDNLSIYYVDMFKEKLLRISNHWSYVAFSQQHSTKMWIRGCWWELHGKRAAKPYTLPHFGDIYAGQVEFSQIQPVHK